MFIVINRVKRNNEYTKELDVDMLKKIKDTGECTERGNT